MSFTGLSALYPANTSSYTHILRNNPRDDINTSVKQQISVTNTMPSNTQTSHLYMLSPSNSQSRFINKPMQFEISIKDTDISTAQITTIRFNKQKGTAIITTATPINVQDLHDNEECDLKVGTWDLKLKKLRPRPPSIGVIGPIDTDESLPEMKVYLQDRNVPVDNIQRLYKRQGKTLTATQYLKLDFTIPNRPNEIRLGYINYPVSDYKPPPLQCFKCQRFGHTATGCHSKERCLYCGEGHHLKDCTKQTKKCANCGSTDHLANYGGCPYLKKAKAIEHLAQKECITYIDAKAKLHSLQHNGTSSSATSTALQTQSGSALQSTTTPLQSSQNLNTSTDGRTYAEATQPQICTHSQQEKRQQSIMHSTPFLMCLLIKLLKTTHNENAMQTLLIDSIMSCNQQHGTKYADKDLQMLMGLTVQQSLSSFTDTAVEDLISEDSDDFPLMSTDEIDDTPNSYDKRPRNSTNRGSSTSPRQNKKKKK